MLLLSVAVHIVSVIFFAYTPAALNPKPAKCQSASQPLVCGMCGVHTPKIYTLALLN